MIVKITVPGSTANIGPGFDTLGLALNLYNTYTFEKVDRGLHIEGCEESFRNENNLVYKSFIKTADVIGKKIDGLKIVMDTQIPISRGLGSSSACIVAGVFGANGLLEGELSKEELFKIAVDIEGHPDNICPSVYGGLTASFMGEDQPYFVKYDVDKSLKFCALIPNFETSTEKAREILPDKIEFVDAVYNISRTAVMLKAFENGDTELLNKSLDDKLHQDYRKVLIHEYEDVCKICAENGSKSIFISGSGPTLMNITTNENFSDKIENSIRLLKNNWQIKNLNADEKGVVVELLTN